MRMRVFTGVEAEKAENTLGSRGEIVDSMP
jgi:hypothetical protein